MDGYFRVTENHIKLLRAMYWEWDDGYGTGAPSVDAKRPYGNSFVAGDVAEIIGYISSTTESDDCDFDDSEIAMLLELHRETMTALRIFLCTGHMTPGTYTTNGRVWTLR